MPNPTIVQAAVKVLLVEVPEDAKDFYILQSANGKPEQGLFWKNDKPSPPWKIIPPGKWSILGKADQLTEDQWKGVVDAPIWIGGFGNMYPNYVDDITLAKEIWKRTGPFKTATESGISLVRANGFDPKKTLILVE